MGFIGLNVMWDNRHGSHELHGFHTFIFVA